VIIGLSLWVNFWPQKQHAIDDLAEEMSWAIHDLVNRTPGPSRDEEIAKWEPQMG
jgi:hypothetical protein